MLPSPKFHEYDVAFVVALALKLQLRPEQLYVKLATGAGVGAGAVTVTACVLVLVPFASDTVSVTVYVPDPAYACEVVFPAPVLASPKSQLYVADESAELPLASKLQVSPEQLDVKLATGGVVDGVALMNPV